MDITTHPFLNILWSFFLIFIWVSWFFLLIRIVGDIFRRTDASGGKKAIWIVVVLFAPLLGALVYLIANGENMAHRDVASAKNRQAEVDEYIKQAAGTGGAAADIERAKALLDAGTIDQAEFEKLKARALA